jgi:CBS domain-containing protein
MPFETTFDPVSDERGKEQHGQATTRVPVSARMSTDVATVSPHSTLQEAAARMDEFNVGALPVVEGQHVVGMITDRDIVVRSIAEGHDVFNDRVRDVMTPQVVFCYTDQDIREAARVMSQENVRRIIVLDDNERLAGILALDDLAATTSASDVDQV